MNITKFEHCCLLLKTKNGNVVTDPGTYSTGQNSLQDVKAIVITHEHGDHYHIDSVKAMIANNPQAVIVTNAAVAKLLSAENIPCTVVDGRASTVANGISFEAFDCRHEEIYEEMGQVQNTGYVIDGSLFIPGDSFQAKSFDKPIEILALPVAGPWCRIGDAIRYGLAVKAKKAFPVHDGGLKPGSGGFTAQILGGVLKQAGTEYVPMGAGDSKDF